MIRAVAGDALLNPATGATTRDAETIDAEGLTLLPGLIDCHVHLCHLGEGLDFARELTTPPTFELMRAVRSAEKTLDAGFTSVPDAAGSPAGVKMAIDAGYFPGPRVFVTVTALSQTGGHTDSHFMCGGDLDIPLPDRPYSVVDGVENMRLRVREVIRARHAEAGRMPSYASADAKAVIDDHTTSIRQAIESGIAIAFGTDMGVGPHGLNAEEFLLMHELGMAPIDCIRSATTIAADTIGMKGVGTLDPGSWGDLIGVPGNPVDDLTLVARPENLKLVVKGGDVVKS